jgi:hypothetical protein
MLMMYCAGSGAGFFAILGGGPLVIPALLLWIVAALGGVGGTILVLVLRWRGRSSARLAAVGMMSCGAPGLLALHALGHVFLGPL